MNKLGGCGGVAGALTSAKLKAKREKERPYEGQHAKEGAITKKIQRYETKEGVKNPQPKPSSS